MLSSITTAAWVDWPVGVALAVGAWYTIWRRVIRPVVRAAKKMSGVVDTLADIAAQFHPDHGESLRDTIDEIKAEQKTAAELQIAANETSARLSTALESHTQVMTDHVEEDRASFAALDDKHAENVGALHEVTEELAGVRLDLQNIQHLGIRAVEEGT